MAIEHSASGLYLHVGFDKEPDITFNRARVRRAFVSAGQNVLREARRLVARRAISQAGELPGFRTGKLAKSVGYRVPAATGTRPGFLVRIAPNQKQGKGSRPLEGAFYPAFLYYGVRRRKHRQGEDNWKISPRKNFMEQALLNRQTWIRRLLTDALQNAVRPVKQ